MSDVKVEHTRMAPVGSKNKLGFWFYLGGEVTLFSTLVLTYTLVRITYPDQYASFRAHLNIPLIALNTFILILSSYFVVRVLESAKQNLQNKMLINLLVVLALGSLFIGGQAYEWSTLFGLGIKLDSTFGAPFFVVTGIHGMHVLVGLAWASIVLLFGLDNAFDGHRYSGVEIFGLYWHFVDIVWIVLFSLIYLV